MIGLNLSKTIAFFALNKFIRKSLVLMQKFRKLSNFLCNFKFMFFDISYNHSQNIKASKKAVVDPLFSSPHMFEGIEPGALETTFFLE